jgi:hypothetical protein
MSLEYTIQLPCEVRRQLPEMQLQSMIKHRNTAMFAINVFREAEPTVDVETLIRERQVTIAVRSPEGVSQEAAVPIAALLSATAPLKNLEQYCNHCPANVGGQPFGCYGKVNYPIEQATEDWLLARLPANAKDPGLVMLLRMIDDLKIDGAPTDSLRNRPEIFASSTASERIWKGLFSSKRINSSQIMHMLMFGGHIGAEQARLYTHLLNLRTDHSDVVASKGISQFKAFLRACVKAGSLNANLLIDS